MDHHQGEGVTAAAATTIATEIRSNNNMSSMDLCVNCCQSVSPEDKDNVVTSHVMMSQNQIETSHHHHLDPPDQLSTAIAAIYKLNYLSAFLTSDQDLNWTCPLNVKLCNSCLHVFSSLYKLYDDFNQLRSMESCLNKEIEKLDNCIQAHQIRWEIKQEIIAPHSHEEEGTNNVKLNVQRKKRKRASQPREKDLSSALPIVKPKVVLRKLEEDPEAQAEIAALNENILRAARNSLESDLEFGNDDDDNYNSSCPSEEEDADKSFYPDDDSGGEVDNLLQIELTEGKDLGLTKKGSSTRRRSLKSKNQVMMVDISSEDDDDDDHDDDDDDNDYDKESSAKSKPKRKYTRKPKSSAAKSGKSSNSRKPERQKTSKEEYRRHRKEQRRFDYVYRRRKTQVPNPCWACEKDFPTPADCFEHTMSEHHQEGVNFICDTCSCINKSKISLACHKKHCKLLKPGELLQTIPCTIPGCDKRFISKSELNSHLPKHEEDTRELQVCTHEGCSYKTRNKYNMSFHIKRQHEFEPVEIRTCTECNRTYKTQYSYSVHMKKMHTEKGFQRYVESKSVLLDRQRERRRKKATINETVCMECGGIEYFTHLALIHHRKDFHGATFSHVCDECGSTFGKSESLKQHKTFVHTTARNYFCDACPRNYKTMGNLRDHYRIAHTQEGKEKHNKRIRLRNQRIKARAALLAQQQDSTPLNNSSLPSSSLSSGHQVGESRKWNEQLVDINNSDINKGFDYTANLPLFS